MIITNLLLPLGHISNKCMQKLHKDGVLTSFDFESFDTCEACLMGKMTKTPFTGHPEWVQELLDITHSDVCGPMSVPAHGGYLYLVTFTDDLSSMVIFTEWNLSLKHLKSSKNFKTKLRIIMARR